MRSLALAVVLGLLALSCDQAAGPHSDADSGRQPRETVLRTDFGKSSVIVLGEDRREVFLKAPEGEIADCSGPLDLLVCAPDEIPFCVDDGNTCDCDCKAPDFVTDDEGDPGPIDV